MFRSHRRMDSRYSSRSRIRSPWRPRQVRGSPAMVTSSPSVTALVSPRLEYARGLALGRTRAPPRVGSPGPPVLAPPRSPAENGSGSLHRFFGREDGGRAAAGTDAPPGTGPG